MLFSPSGTTQDHTGGTDRSRLGACVWPTRGLLGSLESLPAVYVLNGVVPLVASRKLRGPSASRVQCGLGGYWGLEPDALSGSSHRLVLSSCFATSFRVEALGDDALPVLGWTLTMALNQPSQLLLGTPGRYPAESRTGGQPSKSTSCTSDPFS